ncbi:PE family protein, partial [Mycobacterium kansasii]
MPDILSSATVDLERIGETLRAANTTAAAPTTILLSAAQDEVSTALAALFGAYS